jgi:hypothetical protein
MMNLLIKDICQIPSYSQTLEDASLISKFVKERQHVYSLFQEWRIKYHIANTLSYAMPTRWYTQYQMLRNLYNARYIYLGTGFY